MAAFKHVRASRSSSIFRPAAIVRLRDEAAWVGVGDHSGVADGSLFKLMEERYGKRSTIITTNLAYDDWYDFLGNKTMVAALLDRLRHHCHTITINEPSLRATD